MKINEVLAYPDLFNNQIQSQKDLKRAEEYYKKTGKMPPSDFWTTPTITHKGTNLYTTNEPNKNQNEPLAQYRDQYDTDKYNDKFNKPMALPPEPSDKELRQQLINKLKQQNNPNQTYSHYGFIKDKENQELKNLSGVDVPSTPQNLEKLQILDEKNPDIRNKFKTYWTEKFSYIGVKRLKNNYINFNTGFIDEIWRYEDNPDEYTIETWQEEDEDRKYEEDYDEKEDQVGINLARQFKKLIKLGSWDYLSKYKNPYNYPRDYQWTKTFKNKEIEDRQDQEMRDMEFKARMAARMAAIRDAEMKDIENRDRLDKLQSEYMDANIEYLRMLAGLHKK